MRNVSHSFGIIIAIFYYKIQIQEATDFFLLLLGKKKLHNWFIMTEGLPATCS